MIRTPEGRNTHAPRSPLVRAAMASMGEGLMLADESGRIIYANESANRILGTPPAESTSEGWADHYGIYDPETGEPFPADEFTLVRALRGEETDAVEMLVRNDAHPVGTEIVATGRPVEGEDGGIVGAVTIIRDVSALRQKERELQEALQTLEAAQSQKSQLTGFLVHDMKGLLSAIMGNAELVLLDSALGKEDQEALEDVGEAARTLHRMVMNLLDIQAAEDGKLEPDLERVEVVELLRTVAASARPRAGKVSILVQEPETEGALTVEADPELLRRIMANLVDNCLKYGPSDGTVLLRAEPLEGGCRISVSDEGPGVPEELREAIFERYTRVERDSGPRDPTSRGLGLRLCKAAVEAHGGRIWVEDNEPVGARFWVQLPGAKGACK